MQKQRQIQGNTRAHQYNFIIIYLHTLNLENFTFTLTTQTIIKIMFVGPKASDFKIICSLFFSFAYIPSIPKRQGPGWHKICVTRHNSSTSGRYSLDLPLIIITTSIIFFISLSSTNI